MQVEVRPVNRLRGDQGVGLMATLAAVLDAVVCDDGIDLSAVRVVCDWIQYKNNFREVVDVRHVMGVNGTCRLQIAVDARRGPVSDLAALTKAALAPQESSGAVFLEDWGAGRESCIWRFNEMYWQFLAHWEAATGADYEKALPGGASDARNRAAVRDVVTELFAVWDGLDARRALPEDLCIVELGVGNGNFAQVFFDEFVRLDRLHRRDYIRRLRYFMGDYSPHVLERAQGAVAEHASRTSAMILDARKPANTLGFLGGKVFLVYLSNVYDNLPTDELASIDGRSYLVETRAYLPRQSAEVIASGVGLDVDRMPSLIRRLLTLGPELAAEATPESLPDVASAVTLWQTVWGALRLQERYAPLDGLASYQPAPNPEITGDLLRPLLEAGGDTRMHVSNGALTSLAGMLPLLHPLGRLHADDLFTVSHRQYRTGYFGPGKYDGSVVNWVNGALLAHMAGRLGFDVRFTPFEHRSGSNVTTMIVQARD